MNRSYAFEENKLRRWALLAVVLILLGLWLGYITWASSLSHNTVLQESIPELTIYVIVGAVVGMLFAGCVVWKGKKYKEVFQALAGGFSIGFVSVLNCFDVYVYLFPQKLLGYESEYEVVFPGPSRGKYSHCEAGLWIKDQPTGRWIQLCTNRDALHSQRKQGMTGVWVTAQVNPLGSYIVQYEFIYL